jgi:hypothetical protein
VFSKIKKGIWTNEVLEETMDVIERRTRSVRKVSKSWNIPLSSLVDHLNGKTKSNKMAPRGVLTKEEDVVMITWTILMQECGLSISLQQLKMKIAELTFYKGYTILGWNTRH